MRSFQLIPFSVFSAMVFCLSISHSFATNSKLLGTAATTSIEGTAGGGIVPWAVLSGYDTREEISASAFTTQVNVKQYRLNAYGVSASFYDRVEFSMAKHTFELKSLGGKIEQNIYGAKLKLTGDVVYSPYPQISIGVQHKFLLDNAIATAVGATNDQSGDDVFLSATKLHLGLVNGYNLLWNTTFRRTKANQLGLLGFGGDLNQQYEWVPEISIAILPSRYIAIGIDYREKPNNLRFAKEDTWKDLFVAWFPNKKTNMTLAWADIGDVAGETNQQGLYLSLTAYF